MPNLASETLLVDGLCSMNNSYVAGADAYVKGDFAITSTGVVMKGTGRAFTVNPSELEWGETIGRGASGTVVKSRHKPTGTILALKLINMFDKGKREQLMREIHALFDSEVGRCRGSPYPDHHAVSLSCDVLWRLSQRQRSRLGSGIHGWRISGKCHPSTWCRAGTYPRQHHISNPLRFKLPQVQETRSPRHKAIEYLAQQSR
ncbi:Mitogen-activated protein kinase kinase 5 [Aphanomyces cochlioides]|nr:Mitogen-activated protein kinase kinase 5 [Aphanomyces cochlioides]